MKEGNEGSFGNIAHPFVDLLDLQSPNVVSASFRNREYIPSMNGVDYAYGITQASCTVS